MPPGHEAITSKQSRLLGRPIPTAETVVRPREGKLPNLHGMYFQTRLLCSLVVSLGERRPKRNIPGLPTDFDVQHQADMQRRRKALKNAEEPGWYGEFLLFFRFLFFFFRRASWARRHRRHKLLRGPEHDLVTKSCSGVLGKDPVKKNCPCKNRKKSFRFLFLLK